MWYSQNIDIFYLFEILKNILYLIFWIIPVNRGVNVRGIRDGAGRRAYSTTRDNAVVAQSGHFSDVYLFHNSEAAITHVLHEVLFVLNVVA